MIGFNRSKPFYTNATPQVAAAAGQAKQDAMGWTPPPPPPPQPMVNQNIRPSSIGGAWGGMLAPRQTPQVPGLNQQPQSGPPNGAPQPSQYSSTWERMYGNRNQGGLKPAGGM